MSNPGSGESPGVKVLVIDDSNTIRRSAEIFLKQGGYDVLLAEDTAGGGHRWRLIDDQPWRRVYVVLGPAG